ncbi:MAG: penicillin-binding protein 1B [Wenzhouxiangellaceae bacterium]|nr:penicillin-binding protein 1B [Wenzhouxiangellaceae bacterium]
MAAARKKRASKTARTAAKTSPADSDLARLALFALGALCSLTVTWIVYLDFQVREQFSARQSTLSGRVYARALELYPGRPITAVALAQELAAAGLQSGGPLLPGRYLQADRSYTLALPAREFADGREPALTLQLELDNGRVSSLVDRAGAPLGLVRLPPAELGTLLPDDDRDRTLVPLAAFPTLLVAGIQAVEDRQFARHHGVDPRAILRALLRNLRSGGVVQGGSTITQQLIKNLFLDDSRSVLRKINEAIMAISLEARFSKADILQAYLNEIYLGQAGRRAIHGFGRAAEHYFGVPVQSLSSDQIALLVGMVRGASWYHPERNPDRARARRDLVLEVFHDTGLIDRAELDAARARPLGIRTSASRDSARHPAFLDLVRRQLQAEYRDRDLRERGLKIYTTLSPLAQQAAEQALTGTIGELEDAPGTLQGALVLVQPDSGEIRALVGDRQPDRAGFNRALDARRPVGSVVKPFLYLLALADPARFTLITTVDDAPIRVPQAGREDWQPENHDRQSHGRVPLLTALARSYNQATVRIGLEIGVAALFRLLEQLGVAPGSARHPAAFLGAIDLTPLQVAQLYQPLASGGYATPLRAITGVVDHEGQTIARFPMRLRPIRERGALALLDFALEQVVRDGTARALSWRLESPAARAVRIRGKTGTTSDRRDAWFAGYSDQWLAVTWVGRDDNQPAGVSGAASALPVWARLFDKLPHAPGSGRHGSEIEWFWIDWPQPALADRDCPGARALPFIRGSEPRQRSPCMR